VSTAATETLEESTSWTACGREDWPWPSAPAWGGGGPGPFRLHAK
jgi:hypothetical protein